MDIYQAKYDKILIFMVIDSRVGYGHSTVPSDSESESARIYLEKSWLSILPRIDAVVL